MSKKIHQVISKSTAKFKRTDKPVEVVAEIPEDAEPLVNCFCLPDTITLSNGKVMTSAEVVDLKIKNKHSFHFSDEEQETLKLVLDKVKELRKIHKEKE